jgi:hypothetical protein
MQKLEDAIERLKRIREREAAKAKAEGRPSKVSPIQRRMIESSVVIRAQPAPDDLLYQHTLVLSDRLALPRSRPRRATVEARSRQHAVTA